LAPQAASAPDVIASAAPSPDQQQLNAMSLGLAALRQSVDQLAADQEQMTGDIAKLQTARRASLTRSRRLHRGRLVPRRASPRR